MNTNFRTTVLTALTLLVTASHTPASAATTGGAAPMSPPPFNTSLIRCVDSHFSKSLGTCGSDALVEGRIALTPKATLIKLDGALADPFNLYEVYWLALGDTVADAVPAGNFVTDCKGNARGALTTISTATDALNPSANPTVLYQTSGYVGAGTFLVYSRGPWGQDTDGDCVADAFNTVVNTTDTDASHVLVNPPVTLGIDNVQFLSGYRLEATDSAGNTETSPSADLPPPLSPTLQDSPVLNGANGQYGNSYPSADNGTANGSGLAQTQPLGNGLTQSSNQQPPRNGQSQGGYQQPPRNGQTQGSNQQPPRNGQAQGSNQQSPLNGQTQGSNQQSPRNGQFQGSNQQPPRNGQSQGSNQQPPRNGQSQGSNQQSPLNGQTQGSNQQPPRNGQSQGSNQQSPLNGQSQGSNQQPPLNGQTQGSNQQPPRNGQSQGSNQQPPQNGQTQGSNPQSSLGGSSNVSVNPVVPPTSELQQPTTNDSI